MPIGTGIIYNVGDLILSQVSGSGTAFLETKIAAATSSIVYFDNTARINSASLNSITVGTASYVSGSTSIITNLTASNISASGTGSFGMVGIGTTSPTQKLHIVGAVYGTTNGQFGNALITGTGTGFAVFGSNAGATGVKINLDSDITRNDLVISASTGYVGIGTASPGAKLDVNGDVYVSPNTAGKNTFILSTNASNDARLLMRSDVTTKVDIQANGTSHFNGGNVGIGTSVPGTLFQVFKATNGNNWSWFNGNVGANLPTGFTTGVAIGANYSNGFSEANLIWGHGVSSNQYFAIAKISGSTSYSEQLRIDINGNVGIGTTTVGNKLTVVTSTQYDGYYLRNVNGVVGTMLGVSATNDDGTVGLYSSTILKTNITANGASYFNGGSVGIGTTAPGALLEISSSTAASLLNVKGAGGNGLLFVSGSGFVGIGTSSPSAKLEIVGFSTGAGLKLNYGNSSGTIEAVNFIANGAANGVIGMQMVSAGVGDLWLGGSGGRILTLYRDGNVGIGTSSPAYKLDVGGTARVGDVFLVTTATTSDARIEIGSGRSGNGNSYLDLIGDATYTDYGLRLIRYDSGANSNSRLEHKGTGQLQLFVSEAGSLTISTNSSERVRVDSSGYVGIGTSNTTPYSSLFSGQLVIDTGTSTVDGIFSSTNSANAAELILTKKNTTNGFGSLVIQHAGTSGDAIVVNYSVNTSTGVGGTNSFKVTTGGDGYFKGNVGIGTTSPAYKLEVSGSFAATTKSFIIEHPIKSGKKLIYGSLESPYHGIRLTGRDTLKECKCKVELPDYIYKLILHDSVNIQLTGIKCNKTLYIDDINIPENYFTIAYDKTVFESYKDYEFFWDFTAIRADVPELQTEM